MRTYYISADEVAAEAAPGAADGTRYVKARYREYTDASFARQKPRPAGWNNGRSITAGASFSPAIP